MQVQNVMGSDVRRVWVKCRTWRILPKFDFVAARGGTFVFGRVWAVSHFLFLSSQDAYPSRHRIPSHSGLAYTLQLLVEINLFPKLLDYLTFSHRISQLPIRKWKVGCPWVAHVLHTGCPLKQWAAQWTGTAHYLCNLIIISARGLPMGSSVGSSNLSAEKVVGSGQLQHRFLSCLWIRYS